MKPKKFPSIGQFRNVVHTLKSRCHYVGKAENGDAIYDETRPLTTNITFSGTVKLHGTNASFMFVGDEIKYQSRENIISPLSDNAGFAGFYSSQKATDALSKINKEFRNNRNIDESSTLVFFGEWCGGSIQKSVALNQLNKRFVLFGIKEYVDSVETPDGEDERGIWHDIDDIRNHDIEFYNIKDYKTYSEVLDLNNPEIFWETIMAHTNDVEAECPFSKEFGVSGIGEGIIWIYTDSENNNYRFKSKGEKHSVVNKKPKDPLAPEVLNSIKEFADYTVTENRLNQAIEQLFTATSTNPDIKKTGDFIKWIIADIMKEEIDTLIENKLEVAQVSGELSTRARMWFFNYLNNNV